ncbi:MAG: hypothetical protein IKM97_01830 [Clostridia bacterium]|nr:hypothetical protein [Clostridia bacterium]
MYERSAIVLERFFSNLLGFNKENNLKKVFNNYCELFEKFKIVQNANSEEFVALKEFQDAENEIEEIQSHEEKLYKKNAKLEYNRDLIFQNITQNPEEIEKCSLKLEGDISKNQEKLITLRNEFVEAVRDYNEKKSVLSKCKKSRKNAENSYNVIFDDIKNVLDNIQEDYINIAKEFADSDIEQEVINSLIENGKDEKIPFNNQVISIAAKIGFNITAKEVACYLETYYLAKKLIKELIEGAVSMELHEKTIRNISVKLGFLAAEKEYIVGFLDYERITVIYGKRMHRVLMVEACDKLEKDMVQVGNLYEIILKEISEKSTKKIYRDLYNKSYLIEIEGNDAKFKKEKTKLSLSVGTVMNSNYWRIEGIKNIYTVFYKNIVEVFGKDLEQFDVPEEQEDDNTDDEGTELFIQEQDKEDTKLLIQEQDKENTKLSIQEQDKENTKLSIQEQDKENTKLLIQEQDKENTKLSIQEQDKENTKLSMREQDKEIIEAPSLESKIDSVLSEIDELDELVEQEQKVKKINEETVKKIEVSNSKIKKEHTEKISKEEDKKAEAKKINKEDVKKAKINKSSKNSDPKKEVKKTTEEDTSKNNNTINQELKLTEDFIEVDEEQFENKPYKKILKLRIPKKKKRRKNIKHYFRQIIQSKTINEVQLKEEGNVNIEEKEENFDIFGEKYKNIDSTLSKFEELEELDELEKIEEYKKTSDLEELYDDSEEESIFETIDQDEDNMDFVELDFDETTKKKKRKDKKNLFNSLKKLNRKNNKKIANE